MTEIQVEHDGKIVYRGNAENLSWQVNDGDLTVFLTHPDCYVDVPAVSFSRGNWSNVGRVRVDD